MKRKLTPANEKLTKLKKFPRAQFLATLNKKLFPNLNGRKDAVKPLHCKCLSCTDFSLEELTDEGLLLIPVLFIS